MSQPDEPVIKREADPDPIEKIRTEEPQAPFGQDEPNPAVVSDATAADKGPGGRAGGSRSWRVSGTRSEGGDAADPERPGQPGGSAAARWRAEDRQGAAGFHGPGLASPVPSRAGRRMQAAPAAERCALDKLRVVAI